MEYRQTPPLALPVACAGVTGSKGVRARFQRPAFKPLVSTPCWLLHALRPLQDFLLYIQHSILYPSLPLLCLILLVTPFAPVQMWGLMLLGSQGTAWFNTAVLVTSVRNFPRSRGSVVGLLKGLVGLSGAIFAQAYTALIAPDQADYLALIALLPFVVSIPAMLFLRCASL